MEPITSVPTLYKQASILTEQFKNLLEFQEPLLFAKCPAMPLELAAAESLVAHAEPEAGTAGLAGMFSRFLQF